jgi:tetratricopeptide (TPR) repeat protein
MQPPPDESGGERVPQAQGVFSKTPFSNLLVYAMDKGLDGTMELMAPDGRSATIMFAGGVPAKARISEPQLFLGEILVELGMVTDETHQVVLAQHQVSGDLYGQAIVAQGAITEEQLLEGLGVQLGRKVEFVFTLPPDTTFAYYDAYDALEGYGGPELPQIDPFAALWSGVHASPPWEHVHETLTRIGTAAVKLAQSAAPDRFGALGKGERGALELLRLKPHRMVDLSQAKILSPTSAQLLVYCLLITRQVDLVQAQPSMRPPAPGAAPAAAPQRPPGALPQPQSQSHMPAQAGPATGQIGKVQLKQSSAGLAGGVAEIRTAPNPNDSRLASQAPGAVPPAPPSRPPPLPVQPASANRISAVPPAPTSAPKLQPASPAIQTGSVAPAAKGGPAAPIPPGKQAEYELKKKLINDRAEKISSQNYFEMLGVKNEAKVEDVQKAFFALAKEWHPDRLPAWLSEVKDQCSKVFSHMSEAHQTLTDPKKRPEYMQLLKDGGATPDDQAKIQTILEAAANFQKAEAFMKKNDLKEAEMWCRKAYEADPTQADYIAMIAWIEAQRPTLNKDELRMRIAMLDKAIKINERCEKAFFWRGMLLKKMDMIPQAMKDFKVVSELNPRNLDAMRELRLYQMRKNNPGSPGGSMPPERTSAVPPKPRPGAPNKGGGAGDAVNNLFGKLFKK